MNHPSLRLDVEDGTLHLGGRRLGPIDRPETSYRVPGELLGEYGRLLELWGELAAEGRAYRDQVEADYRDAKGAIG